MTAPVTVTSLITDAHGDRYAPVFVDELTDWSWLLRQLEDWLLHADHDTIADWTQFAGPRGTTVDDLIDMLGRWSVRMRNLAQGRP